MSANVDPRGGAGDPSRLTFRFIHNVDGRVTAQINEYPAAISEGASEREASRNALEALHDLTHEPTAAERVAFAAQARLDAAESILEDGRELARRLWEHLDELARQLGRERVGR